jgi:hypothetical protein
MEKKTAPKKIKVTKKMAPKKMEKTKTNSVLDGLTKQEVEIINDMVEIAAIKFADILQMPLAESRVAILGLLEKGYINFAIDDGDLTIELTDAGRDLFASSSLESAAAIIMQINHQE